MSASRYINDNSNTYKHCNVDDGIFHTFRLSNYLKLFLDTPNKQANSWRYSYSLFE